MSTKRQNIGFTLVIGLFLAFGVTGTVLATDLAPHDNGTLPITAPWGAANQDPMNGHIVVVTYEIKVSGNIPPASAVAVQAGIDAWNVAINTRESGWQFDLMPVGDAAAAGSGAGSPSFSHNPNAPPGHGGGGGGPGGDDGDGQPNIQIQLKKGGGLIAGQAQSTIDADGFRVGGRIKISGGLLGTASEAVTITEITMHELGHLLSQGHHSNQNDLMGQTVGHVDGSPITLISACDLDGFMEAHHWLTIAVSTNPYLNPVSSITCS